MSNSKLNSKPMRIFVVDDEKIIAETITMILNFSGFSARCFSDPLEAVCAARFEAPDLLITDVMMPVLSGINLAIYMKVAHPGCRILLLSAHAATTNLLQTARLLGHNFELVSKPLAPKELISRLKNTSLNFADVGGLAVFAA